MRDLWHNGWSLLAIVGLLAAEWVAETAGRIGVMTRTVAIVRACVLLVSLCVRTAFAEKRWAVIISGRVRRREVRRADGDVAQRSSRRARRSLPVQARVREDVRGRDGDVRRQGLGRERPQGVRRDQEDVGQGRLRLHRLARPRHLRRRRRQVQSRRPRPDREGLDRSAGRHPGPGRARQHHRGELSVPRVAHREGPRRDHRHRFGRRRSTRRCSPNTSSRR